MLFKTWMNMEKGWEGDGQEGRDSQTPLNIFTDPRLGAATILHAKEHYIRTKA